MNETHYTRDQHNNVWMHYISQVNVAGEPITAKILLKGDLIPPHMREGEEE
jgi:hypothetical protein